MSDVPDAPEPPQHQTFLATLVAFFGTYRWPGWLAILLAGFSLIPDWESRFVFWADALRNVGGTAARVAAMLPYITPALLAFGGLYLMISTIQEEYGRARQWLPLAGWTVLLVSVALFSSLALFENFVTTSKIPAAMDYLAEKGRIRRLSSEQTNGLQTQVQKIKDQISEFSFLSERDTETLQFASSIFDVLKASGLKMTYGGREQTRPEAVDLYNTNLRGVMIGVQFPDAPPRPAVLFKQAFKEASIQASYLAVTDAKPNDVMILIGGK